jgi:predicted ATPase
MPGKRMISQLVNGVMIDWDKIDRASYLRDIDAISGVDHITFSHAVTFFAGENGSGKSTLLEAIAVAYGFNPEGGTRNYSFSTYDSHSELSDAIRLVKGLRSIRGGYFLRAESFYNVATAEEEYSRGKGGIPMHYHERSHGESFLALVQETFKGNGIYLLDEPEAALSFQNQLVFLCWIKQAIKNGAQVIIATHSPVVLSFPDACIYEIEGSELVEKQYEECNICLNLMSFMTHREIFLKELELK